MPGKLAKTTQFAKPVLRGISDAAGTGLDVVTRTINNLADMREQAVAADEAAKIAAKAAGLAPYIWNRATHFAGKALDKIAIGGAALDVAATAVKTKSPAETGKAVIEQGVDWAPYLLPPRVGAMIGTAIEPGAGTAVGATIGAGVGTAMFAGDLLASLFNHKGPSGYVHDAFYHSFPSLKRKGEVDSSDNQETSSSNNESSKPSQQGPAQQEESEDPDYYTPTETELRSMQRRQLFRQQTRQTAMSLLQDDDDNGGNQNEGDENGND